MPVKMASIQKSTSNKCWGECGEKGTLLHSWWECKLVQPKLLFLNNVHSNISMWKHIFPFLFSFLQRTLVDLPEQRWI